MKKDLPNVFANLIDKKFDNVQEVYHTKYEKEEVRKVAQISVEEKIKRIFNSPNHVYKSRVLITTDKGKVEEIVVGRTNFSILTLNGKNIKIYEINDIEELI